MQLYGYFVLASAASLWLLFVCNLTRAQKRSQRKQLVMYRNALSQAQRYVYDLNQKVEIFRQHDQSYLHTLISSGFSELKEIQQLLNSCLNKVEGLFKTGNISEATALAQWILDQKQRAPELSMVSKEKQEQIDDWQEKTRQLVINCTIAVSHVAEQNESISSNPRKKNRRPTLVNMQELRRRILPQ